MLNDQKKRVAIHTPLRMRVIIIKTMKSKEYDFMEDGYASMEGSELDKLH